jgi:hypothetical protein
VIATYLAWALRNMGRYVEARELDMENLTYPAPRPRRGSARHAGLRQQPCHRFAAAGTGARCL